jgi:hypothetical protein
VHCCLVLPRRNGSTSAKLNGPIFFRKRLGFSSPERARSVCQRTVRRCTGGKLVQHNKRSKFEYASQKCTDN